MSARNAAGLSEPSEPSDLITVATQPARPNFGVGRPKDIVVRAGQPYEIHAPYAAWPLPTAAWTLNEQPKRAEAGRVVMEVREHAAALLNAKAARLDSGHYELTLTNSEGSGKCTLKVVMFPNKRICVFLFDELC